MCKAASTYGARNGVSREKIIRRGQWTPTWMVVDRYTDATLSFPDVSMAWILSGPTRAIKHAFRTSTPSAIVLKIKQVN